MVFMNISNENLLAQLTTFFYPYSNNIFYIVDLNKNFNKTFKS